MINRNIEKEIFAMKIMINLIGFEIYNNGRDKEISLIDIPL